jgi:hypothetical protein
MGSISRNRCTSHVVTTASDRIQAAFGSSLLAPTSTPVSRSAFWHSSPIDGSGVIVVFALARYRVVKIARSCFEVVLQTTKHAIVYPGSNPLLGGNSPMSSGLILKINRGYNGVSRVLEKFAK